MLPEQTQHLRTMRLYRFAKGCDHTFNGQAMEDTARGGQAGGKVS
ncbi:MAG: hypothetical protein O8C63_07910 [Candidatus Methanoperedens sp.]|nr:hypothetical protein [Candidatus Methanoperedens sp.]